MATIVTGILCVVMMGTAKIYQKQQIQGNITFSADQVRRNLVQHIQSDEAWKLTIADTANKSMHCLRTGSPCPKKAGEITNLRNASDKVAYEAGMSVGGFTPQGALCGDFNAKKGNDGCPLRLDDLKWEPLCPGPGACSPSQIRVTGTMIYRPSSRERDVAVNGQNYSIDVIRGVGTNGLVSNIQVFENTFITEIFTVPPGVTKITVEAWGGGGGGGPGTSVDTPPSIGDPDCVGYVPGYPKAPKGRGGAGGGGGYGKSTFAVTPNDTYSVVVGKGGAGGTTGCADGETGGTSSFGGTMLLATGGGGGLIGCGWLPGGAGGTSNGQLAMEGGPGAESIHAFTGGAAARGGSGATFKRPASRPGGGGVSSGSGGPTCHAGYPGADGRVVVSW